MRKIAEAPNADALEKILRGIAGWYSAERSARLRTTAKAEEVVVTIDKVQPET